MSNGRLSPTIVVLAVTALVVGALPATLSAGPLGPTEAVVGGPTAQFPEDLVDVTGSCADLSVGAGVRDITPGVKRPDGSYALWMEPWEDTNGNGVFDPFNVLDPDAHADPYDDENLNGKWDGPWMAGYGHDKDASDGDEYWVARSVHDPVWARALALECGDVRLGLVSLDVVGLFQQHVWDIRDRLEAMGLGFDHVVVASTHTHDSIDTMGLWGPNEVTDGKDPRTMEHVKALAAEALVEAAANLGPVTLRAGAQHTQDPSIVDFAGYVQTDLRDPFAVDDLVLALQFLATDDAATTATLINWSPHPETLAGTKSEISSDFPDQLRRSLETEGATVGGVTKGPLGGTAVYFSGAVGGMMTTLGARVYDEAGQLVPDHSYEKADRIGEAAAWAAVNGLEQGTATTVDGLRVQVREVTFPVDNPFLAALNSIGVFEHPVAIGPAFVGQVDPVVGIVPPIPFIRTELNVITLSSGGTQVAQIVTIPGELLPEIAVGGYMDDEPVATPFTCWAYNPDKHAVNGNRESRPNPLTGQIEPGFERQIAANPDIPPEPVLRDHMKGQYKLVFGLANDELGYIVPANDFVPAVPVFPDIHGQDLIVYGEGTDRCGDDDHYEETVSASSLLAPTVANNLAHMMDPSFEPAPHPVAPGGITGNPAGVGELVAGEPVGVWLDTSGSNGYEAEEDARVQVSLPSWVSGAWGFVDHDGRDQGQEADGDTRGLWVDLNGNEAFDPGVDGVVFVDYWSFHG